MKKLTCEMCGSTSLIKEDGVFVCESCGMKYSVEEAKKLMIEGTVEVQGSVQVSNVAQEENLLRLAYSSFESKNYAQAEDFCNQVIAINSDNYEAWKLKGEAVNLQITDKNDRIKEVYTCIITSYRVLDDAGKEAHRDAIFKSLRACMEGEIDFCIGLLKSVRPTKALVERVTMAYLNCIGYVCESLREMGYGDAVAKQYNITLTNDFIHKINKNCATLWDSVVYYNYQRGGWTEEYHPDTAIMSTFLMEGDNLVTLLERCAAWFNDETPLEEQRECYRLQHFFQVRLADAISYKRMVTTTTNGYGAVTSRREYWQVDQTLTPEAKAKRHAKIQYCVEKFDEVELKMAKSSPEMRKKMLDKWTKERNALELKAPAQVGWIVGCVISALFAAGFLGVAMTSAADADMLPLAVVLFIFGAIFAFVAFACGKTASGKAKAILADRIALAKRLDAKIKELSE